MAAYQPLNGNALHRSRKDLPPHRQHAVHPSASGAADGEHALVLRVDIQHPASLQAGHVNAHGPVHARLLVHGDDRLNGGMGQALVIQHRQCHSHGDAVVAAQRGPLGIDKISVDGQIQPLTGHVLAAVRRFLAHHVHVTLQNHRLRPLVPGGGVLKDDDVVQRILLIPQAPLPGKLRQPVADGLGVARTAGNSAHLLKKVKYPSRLQMLQNCHIHRSFSLYGISPLVYPLPPDLTREKLPGLSSRQLSR